MVFKLQRSYYTANRLYSLFVGFDYCLYQYYLFFIKLLE